MAISYTGRTRAVGAAGAVAASGVPGAGNSRGPASHAAHEKGPRSPGGLRFAL